MSAKEEHPVPPEEQGPSVTGRMPDWHSLWVFLETHRSGSFRAAAAKLDLSVNSVRRRIDSLERDLGVTLITRHVDGIRLTAEGQRILEGAQDMESGLFQVLRTRNVVAGLPDGEVKIAITEGLGTFWLTPRLVEFQQTFPRLVVDVHCAMNSADVLRMEADVAVQLTRPEMPDLKVVKLGRLHVMPYCARSYADRYGQPRSYEELMQHRLVLQVAAQTGTLQEYAKLFEGRPFTGFVAMKTNVSSAHSWAIANGAGIGWLPTYATALRTRVVPIDCGVNFQFDIWLTYHPDADRIPRVRSVIDCIKASFDPKQFPWFRDEFIHPRDFPSLTWGAPLTDLFVGSARNEEGESVSEA